jgi:hypothetical protein
VDLTFITRGVEGGLSARWTSCWPWWSTGAKKGLRARARAHQLAPAAAMSPGGAPRQAPRETHAAPQRRPTEPRLRCEELVSSPNLGEEMGKGVVARGGAQRRSPPLADQELVKRVRREMSLGFPSPGGFGVLCPARIIFGHRNVRRRLRPAEWECAWCAQQGSGILYYFLMMRDNVRNIKR